MSGWRSNASWQVPNTTWHAFFAHFLAVLVPWRRSHVALEVQCDMATGQYDVAHSFCSLLSSFGTFGLEPRRVGGPTRHGGGPMRRGVLFVLPFGLFWHLWAGDTSCWRFNATWRGPNTTWHALRAPFWAVLALLRRSHVALEVQRVMAHSLCDVEGRNTM